VVKRFFLGLACVTIFAGAILLLSKREAVKNFALGAKANQSTDSSSPTWAPVELTDSLTGRKSIEYSVAMIPLEGPKGFSGVMHIRCRARSRDALVIFNHVFSFNRYPSWTMARSGKIVPIGFISARASEDGRVIFLADDDETEQFLNVLKDGSGNLRIRFSESGGASVTMQLPLEGASASVDAVRRECPR
jgi:hypothetical protein